jgi:hypothetical protein
MISQNSINYLVSVMETGCVFFAVGIESLNNIYMSFGFKWLIQMKDNVTIALNPSKVR